MNSVNSIDKIFKERLLKNYLSKFHRDNISNFDEKFKIMKRWHNASAEQYLDRTKETQIQGTFMTQVFESVLGAIYLTHGYIVARDYINEIIVPYIEKDFVFFGDYKSLLQEYVQTDKKSLEYVLIKEYGESHNKTFEVEVKINDIVYGRGVGKSKKEAEQNAAFDAYKKSAK